ncbi:MAG: hypothetical protein AB2598_11010 [Candidatus Thiodiazotropha sp.]
MNMIEMGQVFAYLLKYRYVESKSGDQKRHRPGEGDIAAILQSCSPEAFESFQQFLDGHGLQLREYRDTDFKGIAPGGRIWLMMRNPTGVVAPYMGVDRLHQMMALRENESRLTTSTWFLHVWLMYLALIYTRLGRGVAEVSKYQDAVFTKTQLVEAVVSHLEQVRRIGVDKGAEETVFAILDAAKGGEVDRRVNSFLDLMRDAALIVSIDSDTYQQTLLGAAEFSESYGRTLQHYLHIEEGGVDGLENVTNILMADSPEENREGSAHVSD